MPKGKKFKAVQTGGPSGGCIPESLLDLPVDYDELTKAGSMMGSGGMIVMDEDTCMVDIARYFLNFLKGESLRQVRAVPRGHQAGARHPRAHLAGARGARRTSRPSRRSATYQVDSSLCALGQTAANPVLSTLRYFRDEYEAHIRERYCPAGVCKSLFRYVVNAETCTGCMACKKALPRERRRGRAEAPAPHPAGEVHQVRSLLRRVPVRRHRPGARNVGAAQGAGGDAAAGRRGGRCGSPARGAPA